MKSRQAIEAILNPETYLSPYQNANPTQNPAKLGKGQAGFRSEFIQLKSTNGDSFVRLSLLILVATVIAGCASNPTSSDGVSVEPASVEEMCSVAQCGFDLHIELAQEDGSRYSQTFDAMPIVQEAGVSVYAGQTVYFEADQVEGRLSNLRLVEQVVHPKRTISSRLEQDENGHMMLVTTNPFDKHLRIRMGIMPLELEHLVPTSSCPVIAGGASYEMWPYPIFQVFLGEIRLMDENEPMVCAE